MLNETAESGGGLVNPLAMIDMKSKLKNANIENREINKSSAINQFTMNNLTGIEERIIKEVIHGDLTAENVSVANSAISFDEAVKKITRRR